MRGIFLFAEKILSSQEELGSVETFIWLVGWLLSYFVRYP